MLKFLFCVKHYTIMSPPLGVVSFVMLWSLWTVMSSTLWD